MEMCRPLQRNDTAGAADMEFRYPDQPVVLVNRFDASTFTRSLTRKLGGGKWTFALPRWPNGKKWRAAPDDFDQRSGITIGNGQRAQHKRSHKTPACPKR